MSSIPVLAMVVALSTASSGSRIVPNSELLNEKQGRVIDAATGAGIARAKVIAVWQVTSQGIGGNSGGCILQRIATTDDSGRFLIPNVANDLDLSERGTKGDVPFAARVVDYNWTLIVFEPGFVRQGDMASFDLTRDDPSRTAFAWESIPPKVSNGAKVVRIEDIRMERVEKNFERTVWYYARLNQAISCGRTELEQSEVRGIREEIARLIRPMPCGLHSEAPVKADVAMEFSHLLNDDKFNEHMKTEGQEKWPWTNTVAGALCRAAGSEATKP